MSRGSAEPQLDPVQVRGHQHMTTLYHVYITSHLSGCCRPFNRIFCDCVDVGSPGQVGGGGSGEELEARRVAGAATAPFFLPFGPGRALETRSSSGTAR